MDVYLTIYNNGEPYEDNYEAVRGVFSSHELAEQEIFNRGYTVEEVGRFSGEVYYFRPEKTDGPCVHGFNSWHDCDEDGSFDCDFFECPFMDFLDPSFMRIEKFVLDERKEG